MAAWTSDEDAVIRVHAKTHSATQIAAMLTGRSRASVIGRIWRLGESLAKDELTRRELEHPGRQWKRRGPPVLDAAPPDAWPSASPAARRAALAVTPRLVVLEQLEADECRWPYGEGDLRFCGHQTAGDAYCAAHRGLAYVPEAAPYDADALADQIERRERRSRPAG